MRSSRHGVVQRCILLLLAAAMPLCCCVMRSMATVSTHDAAPVAMSCCSQAAAPCDSDDSSPLPDEPIGCGGSCCIKAPISVNDWTPPVDAIGTPLILVAVQPDTAFTQTISIRQFPHGPPPGPWGQSAPPLRHATILQI
ncbi:MAG: hypothetical protein MK100_06190 [Phycisphaerales bacterium]|nr:hypothetical protein [Phycisphaerales bacterium]